MKGSLIIIGFFILGTLCGFFHLIPFDISKSNISFYALCALMFSVGLSVGQDPQTLKNFRSLNPRLIFLPVATILGTVSAAALVSLILPHRSAPDCMAVGAGFGYYSLSSIFITQYKGPELGTIALLSNIMREIITLLCAPLLVRWFGNLAPIGWRSDYYGYYVAHHYPLLRTAICGSFHIPWFCDGFQCAVLGHFLLFYLMSRFFKNKIRPSTKKLTILRRGPYCYERDRRLILVVDSLYTV